MKITLNPNLKLFLKFSLSALFLIIVLNNVDFESILAVLSCVDIPIFVAAIAVFVVSQIIYVFCWRFVLGKQGFSYRKRDLLQIHFAGTFFDVFVPGGVGGEFYRVIKIGTSFAVISSIFILRLLALFTLLLFSLLGFLIHKQIRAEFSIIFVIILGIIGIPLTILVLKRVLVLVSLRRRIDSAAWLEKIKKAEGVFFQARNFLPLLFGIFAYELVSIFIYFILAHALKLPVSFFEIFFIIPVSILFSSLPISIGGLGVREFIYIKTFSFIGLESAQAVSFSILIYVIRIAVALFGAVIYFSLIKKNVQKK